MRTIQKTISLEPMTSRLPSTWPAYKGDTLYYFDDASLKDREYEFPCNYGLIPLSIAFNGETFEDVINNNFELYSGDTSCNNCFTMSFSTLSNWYHFFNEYHILLRGYCDCKEYSSATQYYEFESVGHYADKMVYGQDENTYIELDELFNSRGGDKFYDWICKNVIPTYTILDKYKDYWKTNHLYYSDVIKWIGWFEERDNYSADCKYNSGDTSGTPETWDCEDSSVPCCECNEYFNRGGIWTLSSMTEWYEVAQSGITAFNNTVKNHLDCYKPKMIDNIDLYNSLDNLGEFSIFCKDYELGIDYRVANGYGASANTLSGTVISIDNRAMILSGDGKTGFGFDPYYMEKTKDEDAWGDYTTKFIEDNPNNFVSSAYSYYAFDDENKMYVGNTIDEVKNSMSAITICPIVKNDAILINYTLYPIESSEYGISDKVNVNSTTNKYFVYRDSETSTPYTLIDGKKVYASVYPNEISGHPFCYYFSFFKSSAYTPTQTSCDTITKPFNINDYKLFFKVKNSGDTIDYISYNGSIQKVETSGVTIDDIDYGRYSGYSYDNNGNIMYVSGNTIFDGETLDEMSSAYTISGDVICIGIDHEPIIYSAKEITGHTSSKIKDLESTNCLVDDIGNKIDGIYNVTSAMTNHQPPQGIELEPLYQIGNVSNLRRLGDKEGFYVGDIITDMVFYYKDSNGNVVEDTVVSASSEVTSLSAITSATTKMESLSAEVFDNSGIYCDVTYYVGATLTRDDSNDYFIPTESGYTYGVEYNETVNFVKDITEYYLKKENKKQIPTTRNSVSAHSVSYPIYVYRIKDVEGNTASFKTEINLINSDTKTNYSNYEDLEDYNGINVYPTFKQEYLMGIGTMENIDSDIYIQRGINAAFEKHLKLGEVDSLAALEQYGNGFFKIMNN